MKLCPCYDDDYTKCLYPKNIIGSKIQTNFKGEPDKFENYVSCNYKKYWGPNGVAFSEITRKDYNKMMKENTYCTYKEESK